MAIHRWERSSTGRWSNSFLIERGRQQVSLKVFHLVFVTCAVFVSLFTGGWGVWASRVDGDRNLLMVALSGFVGAVWLVYYGMRIYAKLFGGEENHAG